MQSTPRILFGTLLLFIAIASSVATAAEPHIGYLYPAGGQRGQVVQISVGGQFLRGASEVYVSGDGIEATVIKYIRPIANINKEQRELIQSRMKEVRDKRIVELDGNTKSNSKVKQAKNKNKVSDVSKKSDKKEDTKASDVKMPEHPLLEGLEDKSLRELAHVTSVLFASRKKRQPNRQIAESVLIELKIAADAQPGERELRIKTATGLTNPMIFNVGMLPEVRELEPNNSKAYPLIPKMPELPDPKVLDLPVLLNGQVMPGDVDRFRFSARKGQKLVIAAHARSLIPYLADAVPGWFQATLTLYDADGKEMAFADDYRFNPDPVLLYDIEKDGEYELEIRDSIYRGREDFVYRISVGQTPFITNAFPLGGSQGEKVAVSIQGWNLPKEQLKLNTKAGENIRHIAYSDKKQVSNLIPYAVSDLPQTQEIETNDSIRRAQEVKLPVVIDGRISKAGDVDMFKFKGGKGDTVVAQVYARRLNSPLDSLLRLTDASSKVIKWNDDYVEKDKFLHKDMAGLLTHHADSYLTAKLPADGTYYVNLTDSQNQGSDAHAYRLQIAAPEPDFTLRVTPSSLSMRNGSIVPLSVHVLRTDGFEGEIELSLKDAPEGFKLDGGRIPAGSDRLRLTLTAPAEAPKEPVVLQLQGHAMVEGKRITHNAVPSENMMQAFLYRHLVPSKQLMVSVQSNKWRIPAVSIVSRLPIKITAGDSADVIFKTWKSKTLNQIKLELSDPPEGVSLSDVKVVPQGLKVTINTDASVVSEGISENLIIEAFREFYPKQKNGKPSKTKRRIPVSFYPAVPIEIVKK